MRVDVLRTPAHIDRLARDWQALEARTPEATGFQSFGWCRAWTSARHGEDDRWRVVTIRDGAELVALLPLERGRLLGARTVGWLGEPWTQYGDALVLDDARRGALLARAWQEISSWADVDLIKLGRVRADAALRALPALTDRSVVCVERAPFVDLSGSRPAKLEKQLRQRRRKLGASGSVSMSLLADRARFEGLRQAIAWKRDWLRARSLASSGLFHQYSDAFLARLANHPDLVVGQLAVGEEPAALEIGLRSNGSYRSLLGAHHPRLAGGSPGHLLIADMIAWASREGFARYDLMVPADPYKARWANADVQVHDHAFALNARGQMARAWLRARPAVKRAYASLPAVVRGRLAGALHAE